MFHSSFPRFPAHRRIFEKGDLKFIVLDLLKEKPSHGYEIMRALEEACHGFYTPSAGSVYPTLQMLEDMSYVGSLEQDGKKVYTITEEGKRFLEERQETVDKIKAQVKDRWGSHKSEDFHGAIQELGGLWRFIREQPSDPTGEQWARIKDIVTQARRDIEDTIGKD